MPQEVTPPTLPATGFVRQPALLALLPLSPSTLWRRVKAGTFPKPHKLSERVTAWRAEDVRAWMDAQGKTATNFPSVAPKLRAVKATATTGQGGAA